MDTKSSGIHKLLKAKNKKKHIKSTLLLHK